MDSRNGEGTIGLMVIGILMLVAQIIAAVVAAIVICLTVAFTLVAMLALIFDGITLWGEHTSKDEAVRFFVRGAIGSVAVPAFLSLILYFLHWEGLAPEDAFNGWVMLAGYAFGSWGIELIEEVEKQKAAEMSQMVVLPPHPEYDHSAPPVVPAIEPVRPFHFASWEDEDLRR